MVAIHLIEWKCILFRKRIVGISRVLQGFEIVLLCCLYWEMVDLGLHVCSLDHDGLLVYLPTKEYEELCKSVVALTEKVFEPLGGSIFDSMEKKEKAGAF